MGCASLLTPETDWPSTLLDRGLATEPFTAFASSVDDRSLDWDELSADPRDTMGPSLLARFVSLVRWRS
jgi:hypothetical protein